MLEYINTHMLIKSPPPAGTHLAYKCVVLDAVKMKTDGANVEGSHYLGYRCVDVYVCMCIGVCLLSLSHPSKFIIQLFHFSFNNKNVQATRCEMAEKE